jgi:hypothetical protein
MSNRHMERIVRVAHSHEEAARFARADTAALSIEERISLVHALRCAYYGDALSRARLVRVLVRVDRTTIVAADTGSDGSHSDPGLAPSTLYRYRLASKNAAGSTDSNIAEATTPAASGAHPNEPPGFVELTERPFAATIEDGWTLGGSMEIVSDGAAPLSPPEVGRMTYAAGMVGGSGPGSANKYYSEPKTQLYFHYAFKLSANWQGHDSNINKILFFHDLLEGKLYEQFITLAHGKDNGPLGYRVNAHGAYSANLAPATVVRGQWHQAEHVVVQSSGLGVADGELHIWFDGIKTHEHYDVIYDGLNNPPRKFANVRWAPTWGGGGDMVVEEMHMYMDNVYVSGK